MASGLVTDDPYYDRYGRPEGDTETETLGFQRSPDVPSNLQLQTEFRATIPAIPSRLELDHQVSGLLDLAPEFQPAASILGPLLLESYDCDYSFDLLARGTAEYEENPREDSCAMMSELFTDISKAHPAEIHPGTLYDIAGRKTSGLDVADVNETDAAFSGLLRAISEQGNDFSLDIEFLNGLSNVEFKDGLPSISRTYEKLARQHVSSMPMAATSDDRLERERVARRVAVLSCLSSVKLVARRPKTEQESPRPSHPTYEHDSADGGLRSEPYESQSSEYTQKTEEATPSLASISTVMPNTPNMIGYSIPSCLIQHGVTYGYDQKQILVPQEGYEQIVTQWKVADAPRQYRDNDGDVSTETRYGSTVVDAETSGAKRKTLLEEERGMEGERQETWPFQHSQQFVWQTPRPAKVSQSLSRLPMSSPIREFPRHSPAEQSSLLVQSSQIAPSTQVERGAHGGRSKKKKRRRTEGF